jgi:hypothetical protein
MTTVSSCWMITGENRWSVSAMSVTFLTSGIRSVTLPDSNISKTVPIFLKLKIAGFLNLN